MLRFIISSAVCFSDNDIILLDEPHTSSHSADTILVHESSSKPSLHLSSLSGIYLCYSVYQIYIYGTLSIRYISMPLCLLDIYKCNYGTLYIRDISMPLCLSDIYLWYSVCQIYIYVTLFIRYIQM